MAIVSLKIGGRFYKFSCNDGQEIHMRELADDLDKRAEKLIHSIGFMPEGQLLAMMALLLSEEKHQLEKSGNAAIHEQVQAQVAESISNLALKITGIAESIDS